MAVSTIAGAVGALVWNVTVTLTNAQIKALPTTAITLVAAPGLTRFIMPTEGVLVTNFSAGAYTNITDGGYIGISSGPSGVGLCVIPKVAAESITALTDLFAAQNQVTQLVPYTLGEGPVTSAGWGPIPNSQLQSDTLNKPLQLISSGNVGDYTGGNAANTMQVTVFYRVIETVTV